MRLILKGLEGVPKVEHLFKKMLKCICVNGGGSDMEWTKFNTHGESSNHAFEVMGNILFESWCKSEYNEHVYIR